MVSFFNKSQGDGSSFPYQINHWRTTDYFETREGNSQGHCKGHQEEPALHCDCSQKRLPSTKGLKNIPRTEPLPTKDPSNDNNGTTNALRAAIELKSRDSAQIWYRRHCVWRQGWRNQDVVGYTSRVYVDVFVPTRSSVAIFLEICCLFAGGAFISFLPLPLQPRVVER
jgi:hypothetical protein